MNITKCPTAYAYGSNSKQGTSVSDADRQALQEHYAAKTNDLKPHASAPTAHGSGSTRTAHGSKPHDRRLR
jgi:hypothetical protein